MFTSRSHRGHYAHEQTEASRAPEAPQASEENLSTMQHLECNFSRLRAEMRAMPPTHFNEDEAAPDMEGLNRLLHHRRVTKRDNVIIARKDVFIHMQDESRFSGRRYDGDKFHLSVTPDSVPAAWNELKGLLFSLQSPFDEFKVTDMTHPDITQGERIQAGAQFTLYARASGGRHYSGEDLARIRDFIETCETRLQIKGVPHGVYPASDVRGRTWLYTTYRNDERSTPEGSLRQSQALQNEPFFRLISE